MARRLKQYAVLLVLLAAVPSVAGAAEAFFSMIELQSRSKLFSKVSDQSQRNNERVQREVVTTGKALDAMGDSLVAARLVLEAVPEPLSARHGELSARFDLDWEALNAFVDQYVLDTDAAFMGALTAHVADLEERKGLTVAPCEPPQGVLGQAMGHSDCGGADYTDVLIGALDADEGLQAAVDELLGRTWPDLRPERAPVVALTLADAAELPADGTWFAPHTVLDDAEVFAPLRAALDEAYRMAERELAAAREAHEVDRQLYAAEREALGDEERAAREQELDAELAKLKAASDTLYGWRAAATGRAIALVWSEARDLAPKLRKELGKDAIGVCVQPDALGGCGGVDMSFEVGAYLDEQKKLARAVGKAVDELGAPSLGLD